MSLVEYEAYCCGISFDEEIGHVRVKLSETVKGACCSECGVYKVKVQMQRPLTDQEIQKECRDLRLKDSRTAFMDENDRFTLYPEPDLSDPANFPDNPPAPGPSWLCLVSYVSTARTGPHLSKP